MSIFLSTLQAALFWLGRGVALIPKQPGSKANISGFGAYQKTITTPAEAELWFGRRRCNIGVVIPAGLLCLDFDCGILYGQWRSTEGAAFAGYIETTARGYHVIGRGEAAGLVPVGGVEYKTPGAVITVAPSVVNGGHYAALTDFAFGTLPIETLTAYGAPADLLPTKRALNSAPPTAGPVVARLKNQLDILTVAGKLTTLRQSGRYWVGRCPFHDKDQGRHFWVDPDKGLCGCHSTGCAFAGSHDVLNLVAQSRGLAIGAAVKALAAEVLS